MTSYAPSASITTCTAWRTVRVSAAIADRLCARRALQRGHLGVLSAPAGDQRVGHAERLRDLGVCSEASR